tara:strand:- start:1070 stop:1303 length:234 start_codon:yes stop_codon:yes gene_type:complete
LHIETNLHGLKICRDWRLKMLKGVGYENLHLSIGMKTQEPEQAMVILVVVGSGEPASDLSRLPSSEAQDFSGYLQRR